MARDRANVWTDIWADSDWRKLSEGAQRLYLLLLTHSTLNYAGVADWRPARLVPLSNSSSIKGIRESAAELERDKYIIVDEDTEEVLIRSFVKHDGLIKSPNLATAMGKAYANIGSQKIREVLAFEVQKLHRREPELSSWERVPTILSEPSRDVFAECSENPPDNPTVDPSGKGLSNPSENPPINLFPTSTSTTTPTEVGSRKKPEVRLPDSWQPTESHESKAQELGLNLAFEVEQFRNHALANDRRQVNWNASFTMWLSKSKSFQKPQGSTVADDRFKNPWKYQ